MSEKAGDHKPYIPPRVVFHSREEILRRSGPAVGCARWTMASVQNSTPRPPRTA